MSSPAQKPRPAPVRTMTRQATSCASASNLSNSSWDISDVIALRWCGRFSVTTVTPGSGWSNSRSAIAADLDARRQRGRIPTGSFLFDLLPPLAPPVGADEDPQLRVPAVRDLVVRVQVVEAVVALLVAVV